MSENTAMMICQEIVLAVVGAVVFGFVVYGAYRFLSNILD